MSLFLVPKKTDTLDSLLLQNERVVLESVIERVADQSWSAVSGIEASCLFSGVYKSILKSIFPPPPTSIIELLNYPLQRAPFL